MTEQLVEALKGAERIIRHAPSGGVPYAEIGAWFKLTRLALDRYRADPEALLRENGEAVRRMGNELMEGKGR